MTNDLTKLQRWTEQIGHWQPSGLSQRAYCAREGLKFSTFDYWRRRIRGDDSNASVPPTQKPATRLTLIPVRVNGKANDDALTLHSPTGWRLSIPAIVSADWLADRCVQSIKIYRCASSPADGRSRWGAWVDRVAAPSSDAVLRTPA